ncbi:hypothetical protein KE513_03655 [Oscillospiraceae bacterium Marseille-Q3528]|nr:hypothetical protein [Oscillospiraceae bacterium Marseille-Q3528]
MERRRKTLEELNLLDNFLFNAMLTYPDTGEAFIRKLLETLFDRKFPHLKIHPQKTFIGLNTGLRGARLSISKKTAVFRSMTKQYQRFMM